MNLLANFESCSCCGGKLPKENSEMWDGENSETGECPGFVSSAGYCGLWSGLDDLDDGWGPTVDDYEDYDDCCDFANWSR